MKDIVKQISAMFLLVVFVISTSGFTVYSHYCNMGGGLCEADAVKVPDCCEKPHTLEINEIASTNYPINISQNCCETSGKFIKLQFSALQNNILKLTQPEIILIFHYSTFCQQDALHYFYNHAGQNLPPPKTGRDILLNQDLLRI